MQTDSNHQSSIVELTFFADPGHGWVRVPYSFLWELGIEGDISPYSYMDHQYAYLEEDCDFGILINAMKGKGIGLELTEKHSDYESSIRSFPSYSSEYLAKPVGLLDLTVWVLFAVRDEHGALRSAQDQFNWQVSLESSRHEIAMRLAEEVERQKKYGWLQDKTCEHVEISKVIRNTADGKFMDFPVLSQH